MSVDQMKVYGSLSLGSRLKRLSDRLVQDVVDIYQAQGVELNPSFFPLFNLLHQQGAQSVTQAAELLGVSHPAISKIARKMIAEGWVVKTTDPGDERRQLLALTQQSEALLLTIRPIWREIKEYLDQLMTQQRFPLLAALDEFERAVDSAGFVQPVLDNLNKRVQLSSIEILGWDASLREDFKQLNLEWLIKHFNGELTDYDQAALDTPESYYLSRGGYIWFARYAGDIVGCVALARHSDQQYEISKMGVKEDVQGCGVGRKLILTALEKARQLGASEVYLESATKLERALRLYRNMGFREIPHPNGKSIYPRSDIYMTLSL